MRKFVLGITLLAFSFASFADTASLCETVKKQIDEREAAVVKTEKIISETQVEIKTVSDSLILLEKKYKRRKAIWIPVATVTGIATIALGFSSLKAIFGTPNTGSLAGNIVTGLFDGFAGFIGLGGTVVLAGGTYAATKPISITKEQLNATQDALVILEDTLGEYEGALDQLDDQVTELKISYAKHCE